jgi:hypothetical protein
VIPDIDVTKFLLEGGPIAVVVYAFYILFTNNLKGQKTYETNMKALQERYIDDLKTLQRGHIETMAQERVLHRAEMRQLATDFTDGLRGMTDNIAQLTHEVQNLDHRVQILNKDAADVRDARDIRVAREGRRERHDPQNWDVHRREPDGD